MKYTTVYDLCAAGHVFFTVLDADEAATEAETFNYTIRPRRKMITGKSCPRCQGPLFLSDTPGYKYQCFNCDEDFYNIEVK